MPELCLRCFSMRVERITNSLLTSLASRSAMTLLTSKLLPQTTLLRLRGMLRTWET